MMRHWLRRLWLRTARPLRTLPSIDAYARWAALYPAEAHNLLMRTEQEAMLALLPEMRGKTVLDLACGTGRYALIAARMGAEKVVGVDNSMAMLQASTIRQRAVATIGQMPFPDASFDRVICGLALGHIPQITAAFAELSRVLKPEGVVLISDFHPYQFLNGAQRTFTAATGETFAVEHYVHLMETYHRAGADVGLILQDVREPQLPGKGPVVLVLKYQKR